MTRFPELQHGRGRPTLLFAAIFCLLYGLFLIALIHTTADGSWFWYATSVRQGTRLYADLHLPLQPLYAIELATFQRWLGPGWLASHVPSCVNLLLFVGSLLLVSRSVPLRSAWRALLMCCAFCVAMGFIMMRFDDYHVLSASIELLSTVVLLRLLRQGRDRLRPVLLVCLGVLCGLCILNRINDGGLLLAASCAVVVFLPYSGSWRKLAGKAALAIGLVLATTGLTVLGILHGLHESFADWKLYSITRAAAIKGGTGHLLLYPFRLPWGTVHEMFAGRHFVAVVAYVTAVAAIAAGRLRGVTDRPQRRRTYLVTAAVVLVLSLPFRAHISHGNVARIVVAALVLSMYVAGAVVLYRLMRHLRGETPPGWSPRELIVLLPLGQLISISLSAALWYPNTFPAAAIFLLLLPIALPWWFASRRQRAVWFSLVTLLLVSVTVNKVRDPFDWFNYRVRSLDAKRTWVAHPVYGKMWMQTDQLALFTPVCRQVGGSTELLSLPFTYANYFCGIAPWHGYVQTFYDTSSRETIEALKEELQNHPPEWILYQRQLDVLSENERAFARGKPLPHRMLDTFLMQQLRSGHWTAIKERPPYLDTSTWLLIHTRRD